MPFKIHMGVPEMKELFDKLQFEFREGTISKDDDLLYKKWGNALKKLSDDPFYPSLKTHEINKLSKRYGLKVWESYLENKTSRAMRMYWVYGPDQNDITVIGLVPHPDEKKNGIYDRIKLSKLF